MEHERKAEFLVLQMKVKADISVMAILNLRACVILLQLLNKGLNKFLCAWKEKYCKSKTKG